MEVAYTFCIKKRFINRGFLIGPLCPIYGVGCVLLYLLLSRYQDDPVILMVVAMVICSVLEYLTSYVMEKAFKTRWWDYKDKRFNINGRICLEMIIPFGLLGLLVVYFLFPFALSLLNRIPNIAIYILAIFILVILLVDMSVSFNIIKSFPKTALKVPEDMTEEITNFVRNTLASQSKMKKRIIDSFPNLQVDLKSIKEKIMTKLQK